MKIYVVTGTSVQGRYNRKYHHYTMLIAANTPQEALEISGLPFTSRKVELTEATIYDSVPRIIYENDIITGEE